ncbi:DNA recombination protein RmuC [Galbitalea soli]|uniref:DNA recombination protein RmuC n=1 Tax=Galbitalea soli TaxID=1268042 RepID=A0A7C9TQC5_9MICO|nr:DNA recombination protein RmuC [Galbitalea soli]NEM90640.1 DNA recombination protein RmuC [Galbitalea soli]NYJ31358.1 DNA recombination protein RmuC [Galbitalea soli]
MDALSLFIGLVIGIVLGGALGLLLGRGRRATPSGAEIPEVLAARHAAELAEVRGEEQRARAGLQQELAATAATLDGAREQLLLQREQFRAQIAQQEDRLVEFQQRLRDIQEAEAERQRSDGKVLVALSPVQEKLEAVQRKVQELEEQRSQQYGALSQQLRAANESEERLRSTAESLASALRSNSIRGVWGETQLRNVVEAAGLIERVDFDVQASINSDAGAGRPDMVIHLPGGKNIAVDAKVPFTAYLEASQISPSSTGEEGARRESLMKQHVKVVRGHIDTLASKAYWAGLDASPELVIAFIPSESLVSSAMEADPGIMDYAFSKRVALASPVTLWSVLKTVAFSWQQNVLTDEAKELFDLSKQLYGRLATLAGHVEKLGRSIESTVKNYNGFVGSMERQVLPTARKLNNLDESTVLGALSGIEESPRELAAFELVAELEANAEERAALEE